MRFWAVSITATSESRFLVHTGHTVNTEPLSGSLVTVFDRLRETFQLG